MDLEDLGIVHCRSVDETLGQGLNAPIWRVVVICSVEECYKLLIIREEYRIVDAQSRCNLCSKC